MKIVLPSTRRAGSGLDDERLLPLINVVFLLLVFFMLAGALSSPAAFRVDPPKSSEAGSADAGASALLFGRDGKLAFGAEVVEVEQLQDFSRRWRAVHPGAALAIKADAEADAAQVLRLLDALRATGIDRVVLMTTRAPSK
jgi:biopolymer transport protein ExbD